MTDGKITRGAAADRQAREAAALRENLRRRKEQQRLRTPPKPAGDGKA